MPKIFTTIVLLVLVKGFSCELNVTCQPDNDSPKSPRRVCAISDFPVSELGKQETYNFHVNYAQPSEIEHVFFKRTADVPLEIEFIPPQIFTAFPNLQIFIMATSVTELQTDNFIGAMNLNLLRLNGNRIRMIRRNVFTRTNRTTQSDDDVEVPLQKLSELSIPRNGIIDIEDHSFNGLNRLRSLILPFNQLTRILRHTFAGLPVLVELNLMRNRIESIEDGAFDLPSLVVLSLYGNKLRTLSDDIFAQLPKLTTMELSVNGLEHIGGSLYNLPELRLVRLYENLIGDIDLVKFAKLPKLQTLILRQSGFTFGTTKVEDGQKWHSPLLSLGIDDNSLTDATELHKLEVFPNLKSLSLNRNPYRNLEIGGKKILTDVLPALNKLGLLNTGIECPVIETIVQKLKDVTIRHDCEELSSKGQNDGL